MDFVRGYNIGIRISSFPPPLMAYDNHVRLPVRRNTGICAMHRMDSDREDVSQQEERSDGPGNFHSFTTEILSRFTGTRALAKSEANVENKGGYQQKYGHHNDSQNEE